jgi:uncharacterized protein (DUF433 family)
MAALDWSQCPAVESVPDRVGGAWVFRGTRLPVATVVENLEDLSVDEVIEQFDVTREEVTAVLEFVVQSQRALQSPPVLVLFDHGTPKGWPGRCPGTRSRRPKPRAGTHSAMAPS